MKQILFFRLVPTRYGRILGWMLFLGAAAASGATAADIYLEAVRQREQALVSYYNDEANLAAALAKYRKVMAKLKEYAGQGVPVEQATPALSEIKEDLLTGAYPQATDKLRALDAALDTLLAHHQGAQTPPPPPPSSPPPPSPPAPRRSLPPPPPPPATARCGATYYTTQAAGFTAYVVEADLSSGCLRVVTDTAYGGTNCQDDCPVFALSHYVSTNGGFAGINGTYFCPADYSACANEDGSFFWKVYNSNVKFMHNANNGLAHLDPFLAVGSDNRLHYYHTYREEVDGRCTADTFCSQSVFEATNGPLAAGIGCGPALLRDGNIVLDEGRLDDKQRTVKSNRGAVGVRGNTLFLVIVAGGTVPDLARALDALPIDHAFNIDGGGSSAMMWEGSYRRGPGRNIPNAIVLVST